MPNVGTASLDLVVDKGQVGRAIGSAVDSNKGLFRGLGGTIGKALFGGFAAYGALNIFKDSIAEAREAQKVGRLTDQVIQSTGMAAHVTAKQVGDLATQLSNMAGVDDEVIQSAENVLLTFTNVRNQVGKGNKVFNQATELALDMSVALGTDLQGSVIQVGKALNDPIKGVTALQRVGVSFTKQQREQIKTLVESGRTLDAQKLILKELRTEFGGAASAGADAGTKLRVAWGNFEEQLGGLILPLLNKTASFLTVTFLPKLNEAGSAIADGFKDPDGKVNAKGWLGTFTRIGQAIHDFVGGTKQAIGEFVAGWKGENAPDTIFGNLGKSAREMADWVTGTLLPALAGVATFLRDTVAPPLVSVLGLISENLTAVVVAWGTFKAISVGADIVNAVSTAYGLLAAHLFSTGAGGHAAAIGIGEANTAAATTPGFMAGATGGVWALAGALGVGLGIVLHNLIEDHFPAINRALEDFGGKLYDLGVSWGDFWGRAGASAVDAVSSIVGAIKSVISWLDKFLDKLSKIPGAGIVKSGLKAAAKTAIPGLGLIPGFNASGGWMRPGSLSWVGEEGPELAYSTGGTRILSHEDSMRAIQAAVTGVDSRGPYAAEETPIYVTLELDGEVLARKTVRANSRALYDHHLARTP